MTDQPTSGPSGAAATKESSDTAAVPGEAANDPNAETWLAELDAERSKFSRASDWQMRLLIFKLEDCGEYPTEWNGTPIDVWGRVQGWGAYWHRYSEPLECPNPECKADLRDPVWGPPGKREIGESSITQDRIVAWHCPDCGFRWAP